MLISIGRKQAEQGDLVDLLLECHGRIRTFVALAKAAGERADLPASEVIDACARVSRYFTEALPLHVEDEEQSLWPRLQGLRPELDRAFAVMHEQHREHGPKLQELLSAATKLAARPGDGACRAALARAADVLAGEFEAHLQLEETEIFPALRSDLSAEDQQQITAELRRRRSPRA